MPFLPQEGPLLEWRRACSWSLKGVSPNGEWIGRWKLLTFSMSKFSILSHKRTFYLSRWWGFSLTERTEFTELFGAQFRAHRTPPAYRVHRALLLKVAVRFCVIGWLNVSVECCVFCSSVSSVRKRMFLRESENSKHPNRNCQNFSVVTPFSVWGKAKLDMRRCSSALKKVTFLCVKDALLDARRASSLMLCVMGWFVVGYKVGYWRYYTPVLKMIT